MNEREQYKKRRREKLQGAGTRWQYHEEELKIDLICVRKQLGSRKKNSNISSWLMMSLIICSFVLVKKQTVKLWFEGYFMAKKG